MLEVCYGARGLSHGAGDPSRFSLEVPLGEAWQEEREERQRSSHGQRREIPSRISNPQWENMFLSSPRIGPQENLHTDGGSEMHHGPAPSTRRASPRCRAHNLLGPSGQTGSPNRYGEGSALREATPGKIQQGLRKLQNETIREAPQQCFNCQKFGHMARTCRKETQTCRYCAGSHPSSQCKGDRQLTLKCANFGEGHATTSRACPKMLSEVNTSKVAQKRVERSQTPTAPTRNAWTKKFVPTMADLPQTLTAVGPPHKLKHAVEVSRPQVAQTKPVVTKPIVADQRHPTPNVPHSIQQKEESQRCGVALKSQPSKPPQPQEDEIEAITIALDGATAVLKRVSTGKKHLIPALRKMIEAALDAIDTLTA